MLMIALLIALACAGVLYGLHLMRQAPQTEAPKPGEVVALPTRLQGVLPDNVVESYEESLRLAGRPGGLEAWQLIGLKPVLALTFMALGAMLMHQLPNSAAWFMALLLALVGFQLPDMWLHARLAQRRRGVQEELPLFAELIAASVSAGLSLTQAVRRVAVDAPGLVPREFLRAVQEMAAGKARAQAWQDLMGRLPGDELRMIVTAIMQAEQYGTSVSDVLRYQVQQIRLFKQQEAQRIAQTVTVKMRVPMLLLILVPFMVLLLSPALLQLSRLLR